MDVTQGLVAAGHFHVATGWGAGAAARRKSGTAACQPECKGKNQFFHQVSPFM
jgi:hypothetical protein